MRYNWGVTERTCRVKSMGPINGKTVYAWIFDDNEEVYSPWFDSESEAIEWANKKYKGQYVVQTKIV